MSTKASSLNVSANNSPTNPNMNTSTTAANTPTVVKIKKELPSDEIKEFAESTMNELLGWYGFDSVDRLDLSSKTSKLLQSAAIISSQQHQHQQHNIEKRRSRSSRAASLLHMHQQQQQHQQNEHLRSSLNSNHNNNNNNNINNNNSNNTNNNRKISLNCNSNYRSGGNDSTTSDHDTRSSRDDDSKSPNSAGKTNSTTTNIIDEKLDYQNCCWCRRPVPENAPEFLTTSDGPRYCSESCFTQSRRASFKKAKTCDWCKHVRHAVSYVDFQDGASQLQFCSDKCLNQYKMQIFCKETQAHLDMNPHLKEQGLEAANNGANLITPDLWLRNCRSRSASPASTVSISPGPSERREVTKSDMRDNISGAISPLPPRSGTINNNNLQHAAANNTSHKPLISVTPASKLMSKSPSIIPSTTTTRQSPKHNRKKRPQRACVTTELVNARGSDNKTNCSTITAGIKPKTLMANLNESGRCSNMNSTNTQSLTQFAASCVQDLHMNVPPLSPLDHLMEAPSSQPTTPHSLPPLTPNRGATTAIPPHFFSTPPNTAGGQQQTQPPNIPPPPPQGYHPQHRPPFMHNPTGGFLPRFFGNFPGLPPTQAPANLMQPDMTALSALMGTPPPVTVMVPYPVIIPLPIPIPVPLPVIDFYKAYLTPEERKQFEEKQRIRVENISHDKPPPPPPSNSNETPAETEQPLDFTKSKETEVITLNSSSCSNSSTNKKLTELPSPKNNEYLNSSAKEEEEISPINSIPSEDSQSTSKSLHCCITKEEPQLQYNDTSSSNKLKSDFVASTAQDINDDSNELVGGGGGGEINQKLPKLKITRLQTKRTLIQTKESECSRPLRKRKRIIDCDFQKFSSTNSKETNELEDELQQQQQQQQQQTTENDLNKGHNNNKK